MIVFTLEENEAQFVLQAIGQLPTNSGAFPFLQKLQQQYQESLTPEIKE
ncbi:MAG: hypothetical protein WCO38_09490 [Verrucomicrobiota bacterium]